MIVHIVRGLQGSMLLSLHNSLDMSFITWAFTESWEANRVAPILHHFAIARWGMENDSGQSVQAGHWALLMNATQGA